MKTTEAETPEFATLAKPILSEEQGYTVTAKLADGSADVTANGPIVPAYVANYAQSGQWPAGKLVPVKFYVTFAAVKGAVKIHPHDFTLLTQQGQIVPAKVSAKNGGAAPATLRPGQRVTLTVSSKAVEGQGSIRWAPGGNKVLIGWIYQLELD
jgi:hypothetical protein